MNEDKVTNYTSEFLNSLNVPDFTHNLQLKVGSVVLLLRNITQPKLYNGTRLAIKKKLMITLIHATVLKGKFKDEEVLIPRITMVQTDIHPRFYLYFMMVFSFPMWFLRNLSILGFLYSR